MTPRSSASYKSANHAARPVISTFSFRNSQENVTPPITIATKLLLAAVMFTGFFGKDVRADINRHVRRVLLEFFGSRFFPNSFELYIQKIIQEIMQVLKVHVFSP